MKKYVSEKSKNSEEKYKSEIQLQSLIYQYFYSAYPMFRIKNEGKNRIKTPRCLLYHNLTNAMSVVTASKLSGAGLTKGLPDLFLAVPSKGFHGLYIELKIDSNKPEEYQIEMLEALVAVGYRCEWLTTLEDAKALFNEYLGF